MHKIVKSYVDSDDLKSLKYVFVGCLDADPTFEDYKEDFEYCRNLPGLIETHVDLTPFCEDLKEWDEDYWIALKKDLLKNFSVERLEHMQKVARVFYKEKIRKIQDERRIQICQKKEDMGVPIVKLQEDHLQNPMEPTEESQQEFLLDSKNVISKSKREQRELEEARKQLEHDNQQIEKIRKQAEQQRNREKDNGNTSANITGKKVIGAVLIVVSIILLIMLILWMV